MTRSRSFNQRIGRNALAKLISELIARLASFALVLFAARQLGAAGFGLYNYALAWGFVLAQLADLGLQLVIAREIAKEKDEEIFHPSSFILHPLLALQLKLLLSIVVVVLMLLLTNGRALPERIGLLCIGLTPLLQTFIEFTGYVFRGRQELLTEVRLLTAARLTTAALSFLVLLPGGNLLGLGVINLASTTLFVGFSLRLLRQNGWLNSYRELIDYRRFVQNWPAVRYLLQQALPLGVAIFLSIAYTRLAILLIQVFEGEVSVAHFSAATRLVEPAQIIPASLMAAVFPAFTLALGNNPQQARTLAIRTTLLLSLLGLGAAVALWLLAPWLIPFLYGNAYIDSVGVLRILGLSILPAFVNYSLTHYLIARGQQALVGIFTGIMLVLHAILCWWAIPRFGIIGPAFSTPLAESLLLCACLLTLTNTKSHSSSPLNHLSPISTSTHP